MAPASRILVTGASGLIGRHALAALDRRGFEVHGVSRTSPVDLPSGRRGVHWHAADLLDPAAARSLVEAVRPTHLLHLAWYADHAKFWDSLLNLDWLSATLDLMRSFGAAGGRRFVGAGSCAEYDWSGGVFEEEKTPLRPATLYGASKASAFLAGSAFAAASGLSFAWGRVFLLFGPGENPARIVPSLIRAHLSGEPLECGPAGGRRDFLPAVAVGEAFAALCAAEVQGAVNIGSGRGITLLEISEEIAALAGRRAEIRFAASRASEPESLVPVVDRLIGSTDFRPPESLGAALAEAVEWWKTRA